MTLLGCLYKKIRRRPAPEPLRKHGVFMLIWKLIRKWLCISVIPFCPFNWLRVLGYRLVGFKIGKKVFVGMQCYLDDTAPKRLVIEDEVVISYRVTFATHGPRMPISGCVLRKGCYIGANATVLGGLEIGNYATIGACALVNRSVPAFSTAAGIPATVIRTETVPWKSQEYILQQRRQATPTERSDDDGKPPNQVHL